MRPPAAVAPASAVLARFEAGASSLTEISETTGLPLDLVRVAVDRLVAMGRLTAEQLAAGCPEVAACGGCALAGPGGASCGPGRSRGPVLLRLAG